MAESVFPKIDGDIWFASEVNNLHDIIQQIYTGSGFDSSGTNTTDTQDHELNAVSSVDRDYVKVKITGSSFAERIGGGNDSTIELKAQIKETGGAYGDILPFKMIFNNTGVGIVTPTITSTYEIIATLTAGQKTNGFQIKVFSQSITNDAGATASFTNIQTVVELA